MFKMVVYNKFMDIMATNANQATFFDGSNTSTICSFSGANVFTHKQLSKKCVIKMRHNDAFYDASSEMRHYDAMRRYDASKMRHAS